MAGVGVVCVLCVLPSLISSTPLAGFSRSTIVLDKPGVLMAANSVKDNSEATQRTPPRNLIRIAWDITTSSPYGSRIMSRTSKPSRPDSVSFIKNPVPQTKPHVTQSKSPVSQKPQGSTHAAQSLPSGPDFDSRLRSPHAVAVVFPSECSCVLAQFCKAHEVDIRSQYKCGSKEKVCCYMAEDETADQDLLYPNLDSPEGEAAEQEFVEPNLNQPDGEASFQDLVEPNFQQPEGEPSTEHKHKRHNSGEMGGDDNVNQHVGKFEMAEAWPDDDQGLVDPTLNPMSTEVPPKVVTKASKKCVCPPSTVTPLILMPQDDREDVDLDAVEGPVSAQPLPLPKKTCGVDQRYLLLELKTHTKKEEGQAEFAEFPWTVLVMLKPNGNLCGGTIVHPKWIITAAHCVHKYKEKVDTLMVRAGEFDTRGTYESLEHEDMAVKRIEIHPGYDARQQHNDLALLELQSNLNMGDDQPHLNRICLPKEGERFTTPCVSTGWGARVQGESLVAAHGSTMKKVSVQMNSRTDCENRLRQAGLGARFNLSGSAVCATSLHSNLDSYLGDGGGPLSCTSREPDGHATLLGVVSWGKPQYPGAPGVYASIRPHMEWINSHLYDI